VAQTRCGMTAGVHLQRRPLTAPSGATVSIYRLEKIYRKAQGRRAVKAQPRRF
jgi:hypothetical protein